MTYAVVAYKGHQYIVAQGDSIVVDRVDAEEGSSINIENVVCTFDEDGKTVKLGAPYLDGAKVVAQVAEHKKGKKTRVLKFQSKKRYQKVKGFRPYQTVLTIESITG